jgi:Domain of unknown function (DUF4276)
MTTPFVVVPVVEGHGEVQAVPILLRRLAALIDPLRPVDVRQPIRGNRSTLTHPDKAERFLSLAVQKLGDAPGAVLVLLDADDDCAADVGPALLQVCERIRPGLHVSVVLATIEYEAWFLAAATSIRGQRGLPHDLVPPSAPETVRDCKGWLQSRRTDGLSYGATTDQPALTALFDLGMARSGSPSFDKLWRDVERLMAGTTQGAARSLP